MDEHMSDAKEKAKAVDDLITFLQDRLDEDEQVARATMRGVNRPTGEWTFAGMQVRDERDHLVVQHTWPSEGEHIARHDPARVLREVAATRKLIEWIDQYYASDYLLKLAAAGYANHRDYDERWRP